MKHKILSLALAAMTVMPAAAQELRTTYFMQTSNYRHEMNPALLDSAYIGVPLVLGNLNLGLTGNMGLEKYVYIFTRMPLRRRPIRVRLPLRLISVPNTPCPITATFVSVSSIRVASQVSIPGIRVCSQQLCVPLSGLKLLGMWPLLQQV